MKSWINSRMKNNRYVLAAFFMPLAIMVLAFALTGIYPFGGQQISVIDMYHQYVPFLSELQHKLQTGGSLFYTWNGAGGSNFWCLLAYYGASPLNFILILFPSKLITEGITVILLIKIGLAGAFMYLYLRELRTDNVPEDVKALVDAKASQWQAVAFACLYALCSYVMAYFWCIMWIDSLALLPLLILGLRKLIYKGKALLYTVTLALIVLCNYYIAILICIFVFCYYPVLYFERGLNRGIRGCAATTGRAIGYSLLGIAMAAFMLLPTFLSMQNAYYISSKMPEKWSLYNDPLDILNQLLPQTDLTFREGLPNIYCGMIVVILLFFYFINRRIALREKAVNGALLVFFFFSLNTNVLDFIWHAFHFPNQLPFRYSFVISFVLISLAFRSLSRLDGISLRCIYAVIGAGLAYYLIADKLLTKYIDDRNVFVYLGIALLAAYCIVFALYRNSGLSTMQFTALLIGVIAVEMGFNACLSFEKVGNVSRDSYLENIDSIGRCVDYINDRNFARAEMKDAYILNTPALYHYRGVSQFSSSINSNATLLMEQIGLEGSPGKNRFNYNSTDPVTNAMLNIRYLITGNKPMKDSDFRQIKKTGYNRIYENKYPLAIGYMTADSMRTWHYQSVNPFDNLNDYIRAATDNRYDGVFKDIGDPSLSSEGRLCRQQGDGSFCSELNNETSGGTVNLIYKAREGGKHYVFVEAEEAEEITVKRANRHEDIDVQSDCGSIINIGNVREGESFAVKIKYKAGKSGSITSYVCTMDEDLWEKAYDILSRDTMKVTDSGDSWIKGSIDVSRYGLMLTSIPYESGWKVYVDGQRVHTPKLTGGLWISLPLDKGSHEIEFRFRPPGLIAGTIISVLSILLLIGICRTKVRIERRRMQSEEKSAVAPEPDETVDDFANLS